MKLALAVSGLALAALVSGCNPAVSIHPLYTDADRKKPIVEPRIEGEWISPDADKVGTDEETWLKWKILAPDPAGAPYGAYSVEFRPVKPDPRKGAEVYRYDVELIPIGDKLFFDAEFRGRTQGQVDDGPSDFLGLAPAHVVGRVWVQQDFLRIALLEPGWVEKNSPESFREIIPDKYVDTAVITGSTQELRDFLLRNADNQKALGYAVYLCRPGTDCATRAAEDALVRSPDDDELLETASKLFLARHNYARAAALQQQRTRLESGNFDRRTDLGEALLFKRDFGGARREFGAAQDLVLGNPPAAVSSLSNYSRNAHARASEDMVWSYFLEGEYAEAVSSAEKYKPDEEHASETSLVLSYFSLLRLGRREAAESLLKDEIAKFRGSAEEHILLLDAEGRVSEGFPYDPKSEALRRAMFFGGLRDVAAGKPDAARIHLGYAASEHSDSVIALAARIELERLGPEPKKQGQD